MRWRKRVGRRSCASSCASWLARLGGSLGDVREELAIRKGGKRMGILGPRLLPQVVVVPVYDVGRVGYHLARNLRDVRRPPKIVYRHGRPQGIERGRVEDLHVRALLAVDEILKQVRTDGGPAALQRRHECRNGSQRRAREGMARLEPQDRAVDGRRIEVLDALPPIDAGRGTRADLSNQIEGAGTQVAGPAPSAVDTGWHQDAFSTAEALARS